MGIGVMIMPNKKTTKKKTKKKANVCEFC